MEDIAHDIQGARVLGEGHQAIRRAGGNPDRPGRTGKGGGRFNARGRGAATASTLKDRSAWSRTTIRSAQSISPTCPTITNLARYQTMKSK
jgi:hypothetical protein